MSDMLVRLYALPDHSGTVRDLAAEGVVVRRALSPEKHVVVPWVTETFGVGWADEVERAFSNVPISCFIAISDGQVLGFATYDTTMLDYFGPIGVAEASRGRGVGKALIWSCLDAMWQKGYAYAVIGWAGPGEFYAKTVGAVPIDNSEPGVYRGMLR